MKKLIATVALSSIFLAPVFASPRSECLKTAWQKFKADAAACKDLQGTEKDACHKAASKKSKENKAACPTEAKSAAKNNSTGK